jgi:hypothetical protein
MVPLIKFGTAIINGLAFMLDHTFTKWLPGGHVFLLMCLKLERNNLLVVPYIV